MITHFMNKSISNKRPIKVKLKKSKEKNMELTLNTTNTVIYGPLLNNSQKLTENAEKIKSKSSGKSPKPVHTSENNKENLNKSIPQSEPDITNIHTAILNKPKEGKKPKPLKKQILCDNSNKSELSTKLDLSLSTFKEIQNFPLLNEKRKDEDFPISNSISSISIFEGGYKKLPSVRNILQATMPPERKLILEKWEMNMIMKLGEEGFQNYRQGLLDRGKIIHECIELKLRKEEVTKEQLVGIQSYWESISHVLPSINNIRLLESRVIHSSLNYQGSIDCVGTYEHTPVVIEFKTSSKPKLTLNSTYDDPLQLAAYIGAFNYDSAYHLPNINAALLVIAYSTGLPAHVHILSKEKCLKYWTQWCQRLSQYMMKTSLKEKC